MKKVYIDSDEFAALLTAVSVVEDSFTEDEAITMFNIELNKRISAARNIRRLINKYINA